MLDMYCCCLGGGGLMILFNFDGESGLLVEVVFDYYLLIYIGDELGGGLIVVGKVVIC